jgi:hypothetical protein
MGDETWCFAHDPEAMRESSECNPLDCDMPSCADESQHARKDTVSMFKVKVSRMLSCHHLTPATKIKNILSIIYHMGPSYNVTEFDVTP